MECIETGRSDLKAQVCFLPPPSTEYESPSPSLKINFRWHRFQDTISIVNSSIKSPKDYYALRVQGNSMIEEGIFDGDIVVIKKQSVAENGQTVVAIIDDNEATLKKLYVLF